MVDHRAPPACACSTTTPRAARSHQDSGWVQVSRLGNPLINEVVIPIGQKDKFNRTSPADDARNFGKYALNPEVARLLNALFNLGVKDDQPDGHRPGAAHRRARAHPDRQEPRRGGHAQAQPGRRRRAPRRTGSACSAGDLAGFPNGRRLADDVVDIELRVIAGALLPANQGGKQIPLGDGVDQNDKPFRSAFPYVALPTDGFTGLTKRTEPRHAPVPQPPA